MFPRHAATDENIIPVHRIQILDETVEACGEISNKLLIEYRARSLALFGQHFFHHSLQHSNVAINSDRQP